MATDYTNQRDLPDPIARAIEKSDFSVITDGMSASRLNEAPQITHLKSTNKVTEDVADKTWTLIRRGMLHILEQGSEYQSIYRAAQVMYRAIKTKIPVIKSKNADDPKIKTLERVKDIIAEFAREHYPLDQERWVIKQTLGTTVKFSMDRAEGIEVEPTESVQLEKLIFDTVDLYDKEDGVLYLLKLCDVSAAYKPHMRTHWEREANIQAYILHHNGMTVKSVKAIMFFKDYSEAKKNNAAKYPSSPSQTVPLNLESLDKTDVRVKSLLRRHEMSSQGDVPECTPEDRWATADEYAACRPNSDHYNVKKGFATPEGAQDWINEHQSLAGKGCIVDIVPGQSRRCESYCSVRHVCGQWKREQEKLQILKDKTKK